MHLIVAEPMCLSYNSMIIFVGAVKIIDGEDESWKTRIFIQRCFPNVFNSDLLH